MNTKTTNKKLTIQKIAKTAEQIIKEDGFHNPMIFVEGTKAGTALEIPGGLPEQGDLKRLIMLKAGEATGKLYDKIGEARSIFFVSEAWASGSISSKSIKDGTFVRPSQDPNRVEILMIMELDAKTNWARQVIFEQIRDEKGKLTGLKDFQLGQKVTAGSKDEPTFSDGFRSALMTAFVRGYTKSALGLDIDPKQELEEIHKIEESWYKEEDSKKDKLLN